ncbi:agmatinase [Arcticibacter tournemirensis]|uniref:Agmatinase n=2 Tax=Arcticibacter tournemirensis TaxID=699437 RepID=A0A4Q0ME89_9SPHI|nr:agmatinase [Arcticibacter tournemirensis]
MVFFFIGQPQLHISYLWRFIFLMKALDRNNFLGLTDKSHCDYANCSVIIQQLPYEYTSSYLPGSSKGPAAIVKASEFVETYDEEIDADITEKIGIGTLVPASFNDKVNEEAVNFIANETSELLSDNKFVVSLGAEHTVTFGIVKAFAKKYRNLTVLQIDAHSDLRFSYHDNIYSHASVMARIHEMGLTICQAGIRAQSREEADLIKKADNIHTFYAHQIRQNPLWMEELIAPMSNDVYITIDADGFDPSVIPAVGTAEPNGLFWGETLELLKMVCKERNVVGFDVVECAPVEGSILSEYTLAKLIYKLIGYRFS